MRRKPPRWCLSASVLIIAMLAGCDQSPAQKPTPTAPSRVRSFDAGPRFTPNPSLGVPSFHSRYALPGSDAVVLEQAPRPAPTQPIATSSLGLAAGCDPLHYLLDRSGGDDRVGIDNRFNWWGKQPPASGPLRPPASARAGAVRDSLICHFHPALARVVGASHSGAINAGFKMVAWDDPTITSPNTLPDVEFIVRAQRPQSIPVVRELNDALGRSERVLINDSAPGYQLDLSGERLRPSLWLDFAVPQRAVVIEYGIPVEAEQGIQQAGIKLIGYDRQGRALSVPEDSGTAAVVGDGRPYNGRELALGDFGNVVGIQDRDGRISTVELRFDYRSAENIEIGGDPGPKIQAPQVVRRIWHEPLPPAAVLQGFVGVTTLPPAPPSSNVLDPPSFEQRFGKAPGPEIVTLPFRFDRAIVMIRGVHWEFTDQVPRPITELSAEIKPFTVAEFALEERPEAWPLLSPRRLTLTPAGRIIAEAGTTHAFHLILDYTLLGWSSEQVEIHEALGAGGAARDQNNQAINEIVVGDPCPFSDPVLSVERRRELCGPLFGALQRFAVLMSTPEELGQLDFATGSDTGFSLELRRDDRNGQAVAVWVQGVKFFGSDSNRYRLEGIGTVLSGPSLRVGPDRLRPEGEPTPDAVRNIAMGLIPGAQTGPRDDHRSVYMVDADIIRRFGLAWPVVADIGFVALGELSAKPVGDFLESHLPNFFHEPIQELDFEVKGESYQGSIIDWKTGLGINTEPIIIGGIGAGRERDIGVMALFGGVSHMPPFRTGAGTKRDLVFEDGVEGLTQRAVHTPGLLHNTGRDALWIDDIRKGTLTADSYFEYLFRLSRHPMESAGIPALGFVLLSEQQFRDRLPMMLRPGEQIEIFGQYTPGEPTSFLPHMGSMEFRVRSGVTNGIRVFALGTAVAAEPGGEWRPTELVFPAAVSIGAPPQWHLAALVATGRTPLAVRRLYLEDETLGYHFEVLTRIEPEALNVRVTCGTATASCDGQTRLIADTNAGVLPIALRKEPPFRANPPHGTGR